MGLNRRTRLSWRDWNPGLDNDHLSLGFVLEPMPAIAADEVAWIIRLLENPASPLALPGAITLDRAQPVSGHRGQSPPRPGLQGRRPERDLPAAGVK